MKGIFIRKPTEYNVIDSLEFKYKNGEIRIGSGLFPFKLPASSITSCERVSYWEDLAFHKVRITFEAEGNIYVIEGRTYDAVNVIPFKTYYENMVRDSGMSAEEKEIALKKISYEGADSLAKAMVKQAQEPITTKEKDASVVGRAVVGAAIAGPTGAIVGALSAVDKNNKNNK